MEATSSLTPMVFASSAPWPGGMETLSEVYRRAVLRPPPRRFMIEFLPISTKGSHHHGMRISPLEGATDGDSGSVYSRSSRWQYEIWRKWEDILWFQQTLESEYSRAAREKKVRLAQGKGVKSFHGLYKQDMASSFESLPQGPLPSSVAQDVHEYLPRLTKKGTIFRATQSTIDQRQRELRALVEALFSDTIPTLVRELRDTKRVKDFFGLWRRDYDCMAKAPKNDRDSITSSVFSTYFSESVPPSHTGASIRCSSSSPENSPMKESSRQRASRGRPRSSDSTSSGSIMATLATGIFEVPRNQSPSVTSDSIKRLSGSSDEGSSQIPTVRPRALSNTSSDTCSTQSDEACSEVGSGPVIVGESPITFDHNPILPIEYSSVLEVLPEEREMLATSPETYFESSQNTKPANVILHRKANRAWQVVSASTTQPTVEAKPVVRESWQTTTSIGSGVDALLDGIPFTLPDFIKEDKPRAPRASIASMMTVNSADAVLPRERTAWSAVDAPRPVSMATSGFDTDSDDEDNCAVVEDRIPFPSKAQPQTPTTRTLPTTPTTQSSRNRDSGSSFECPSSPTTSEFSMATTTPTACATSTISDTPLSIKAAYGSSIIMVRVERNIPFENVRQRLYNKFVGQEGVPLSNDFAMAMVVPSSEGSSPSSDKSELHFIDTQYDWEHMVLVRDGNKVTLKILDTPSA